MRISDRIYLVGSGKHGHELTHRMDCNVYLLDGGSELALIDAGSGLAPERIIANIEQDGFDVAKVKRLLLTHVHGDHGGGAYYFHREYGMEVIAAAEAAPWLEQGDKDKTSIGAAIAAGVYPADYVYPACPVARSVREGDRIAVGELELEVLETPGHSRGHVSFALELEGTRSLFAGDVVFAGGKVVIQNIWDCFIGEYADSMDKLNRRGFDRLFSGHGPYLLSEAWRHIEQADACFKRLDIPPNL
ncbi:MBL fold metallo-hydrolase [Paenibacillus sp. MBLB4367]|uniref:MBL fold metallo-hydrolase n=1 Tax=Paenibacillus sp. MBLB4367 TaxID=3384767 RepID=UPI0039083777